MSLFLVFFPIALGISAGYAAGRIHEWYRHALERDQAWRAGYDQASGTLFKVATKVMRRKPGENTGEIPPAAEVAAASNVTDITEAPSAAGRHSYEDAQAVTRRLKPIKESG
jgi:hypothetical protein